MEIFGITPVAAILSHSAVTPLRAALVLVVAFVAAGFTLAAAQPSASRLGPGYDIDNTASTAAAIRISLPSSSAAMSSSRWRCADVAAPVARKATLSAFRSAATGTTRWNG